MQDIDVKYNKLKDILMNMKSVVIGFSGGVDSTFLLKVAVDVLGKENVLAVTSSSETHPAASLEEAIELAQKIGARHKIIKTDELNQEQFISNDKLRCYYCKYELFSVITSITKKIGFNYTVDGSNYDDQINDYRPGLKAVEELGVHSPLQEAELTKKEIRDLSKKLGLETWDKPAFACLATRFPYGEEITEAKLKKIGKAEAYLNKFSFKQLRARHHDDQTIRIEVTDEDMELIMQNRKQIIQSLKEIGYNYIALDLEGYRTGSMNEVI